MLKNPLQDVCALLSITAADLSGTDVLLLPEGIDGAESLSDANDTLDSIALAKHFKSEGLACKTAFDFGANPAVKDRRGVDLWLGVVWIIQNLAAPTIAGVLATWIAKRYLDRADAPESTIHVQICVEDRDNRTSIRFDGSAHNLVALLTAFSVAHPKDFACRTQRDQLPPKDSSN